MLGIAGTRCVESARDMMNVPDTLSSQESWRLLVLVGVCMGVIVNSLRGDGAPLFASVAFSGIAFAIAFCLIRWLGRVFMAAGLKGRDMAKPNKPEMYGPLRSVFCVLDWGLGICAEDMLMTLDRRRWALCVRWYICSR